MADSLLKIANAYFMARDISSQALVTYAEVVKRNPKDTRIRSKLQLLMQSTPYSPEAHRLLKVVCADSAPLQCLEQLLLWDLESGDFKGADQQARRILRRESTNQTAHHALAYLSERQSHFADARKAYASALMWFDALRMAVADHDVQAGRQCVAHLSDKDRRCEATRALVASLDVLEGHVTEARAKFKHVTKITLRQQSALDLLAQLDQVANGERGSAPTNMPDGLPNGLRSGISALVAFKAGNTLDPAALDQIMPETRPAFVDMFLYAVVKQQGQVADMLNGGIAFSPSAVRAAAFASLHRWTAALSSLPDAAKSELTAQIRQGAIQEKLRSSSFAVLTQQLSDPTEREAVGAFVPYLAYEAWRSSRIAEFTTIALHDPALDTLGLHRIAVAAARSTAPNGTPEGQAARWAIAIAAWAAVLSDEDYWSAWVARRREVFGINPSDEAAYQFRTNRLPELIRKQGETLAESLPPVVAAEVRRTTATLASATEDATAVRMLLRAADRKRTPVPRQITSLISPSLIRQFSPDTIPALAALTQIEGMSCGVRNRVLHAISPLAPVYTLVDANQPEAAVILLRSFQPALGSTPEYGELNDTVLRLTAQHFAEMERWSESLDAARELLALHPREPSTQVLVAKAACGLGNTLLQKGEWKPAVDLLRAVRSSLDRREPELDAVLAEALVRQAIAVNPDMKPDAALPLAEEALTLDPSNQRGKLIAAQVYHNWAVKNNEAKQYRSALDNAKKALVLDDDPATRRVFIVALIGLKEWDSAFKALEEYFKLFVHDAASFDFWVRLHISIAFGIADQRQYEWALEILKRIASLDFDAVDYDPTDLQLPLLLSELHTNYGYELAQRNNVYAARQQWQLALRYNPANQTARENLRIAGGRW